ncbi:39S ribosomal protein L37, mitochondrial [Orussus abietinus]|uniref:39S ribosomal protein L37, mitochondrial n=1 Tax=Orussus abietinus TaxID=222816 RepID=UPI00062504BF|nr:39S ribosomal protein L37, mitochondrial [Orussus abietinus]
MRITLILCRQHLGRMTRRHWRVQGVQIPIDTGAERALQKYNVEILNPVDIMKIKHPFKKIEFEYLRPPPPLPHNRNHPNWSNTPCFTYKEQNALLEGVAQAQILTKTIIIENDLPQKIKDLKEDTKEKIDNIVQRIIRNSTMFDAHQELLPKLKNPDKPMFVFPRVYGLTTLRKVGNLAQKLIHLCENLDGADTLCKRSMIYDGKVSVPLEKDSKLLQFNLTMNIMINSAYPLSPILAPDEGLNADLPSIEPCEPTISLSQDHIYVLEDIYPIDSESPWMNVHTIFIYDNPETIKNLTELPVTESQVLAQSMLKSFAAAAACAKQRFGAYVKELPEPITIQCIQSDGKSFYFSVFQLNTLNLNGVTGTKNFWWCSPKLDLFEKAMYEAGIPTLTGYNPEVFKTMLAFFKHK